MFTCGQFERSESTYNEYAFLSAALQLLAAAVSHQSFVNTTGQKWCLMTTLQMATPVSAEIADTRKAQEARWIAWRSKGAAADRITQRRVRIAFTVILIALGCVTLAMNL